MLSRKMKVIPQTAMAYVGVRPATGGHGRGARWYVRRPRTHSSRFVYHPLLLTVIETFRLAVHPKHVATGPLFSRRISYK